MWWWGAAALVYLGFEWFEEDSRIPHPSNKRKNSAPATPRSVLENNLNRLREIDSLDFDSKLAVIGQPGSGKSSLLMSVTEGNCHPKPKISNKTDATNWSLTDDIEQVIVFEDSIFVDTPGYDTASHSIRSYVNHFPFKVFSKIIFVFSGKIHNSDEQMLNHLYHFFGNQFSEYVIAVRTYSENLTKSERKLIKEDLLARFPYYDKENVFFVCNKTKSGIAGLKKSLEL